MTKTPATSRPQSFTIEELVRYAENGRLRVPEFQRNFRWGAKDIVELFDSIRRGYPVGNALLWKRDADSARVHLGALSFEAPSVPEALWVVDGQQRVTSLVNAVNSDIDSASVFAVSYLPAKDRFVRTKDVRGDIGIPLPDLFSIPRLLGWLQQNPDASSYIEELQGVTTTLRDFSLPSSVVEGADEAELRRIFDRINSAGRRLTAAEVFDAINRTSSSAGAGSVQSISDSLASTTDFGVLPSSLVYQALLVRRHPDITRSPQSEFESDRRALSDFPAETAEESFSSTEKALTSSIRFLQEDVGVPHFAFLPQQFLLLIVVRFFGLHPNLSARTRTLLIRWFWRAASRAPKLGFSGASNNVRSLAGLIRANDESGSIKRLLGAVRLDDESVDISLDSFRTNQAASKIVLCAMWAHGPRSLDDGEVLTVRDISSALGESDTLAFVVREIFRRSDLTDKNRLSVGNRLILDQADGNIREWRSGYALREMLGQADVISKLDTILESHYLNRADLGEARINADALVSRRQDRISKSVENFIRVRGGLDLEDTPSLSFMDLDDYFDSMPGFE